MKAWRYSSVAGGIENNLKLESQISKPEAQSLAPGQILIHTASVSLNPADYKVPEIPYVGYYATKAPAPAMDFSGRVAAFHPGITSFTKGQRIFGRLDPQASPSTTGVLSEYIVANESDIAPLGDDVDFNMGAALGTVCLTEYQALQPFVKSGQHVFINGGSGGTGSVGIQIAKILGCTVTTSCSGRNVSFCKNLGADQVLDYQASPLLDQLKAEGQIYDHVIDNSGSDTSLYKNAHLFLKSGGLWVQIGGAPSDLLGTIASTFVPTFLGGPKSSFKMMMAKNDQKTLQLVNEWVMQKKLKAIIDTVYQFHEVPDAFTKLKKGRSKGKIVIIVNDLTHVHE
jgi:NADPH:quinone reductase-like Zn-dependent oxidoreductase